MKRRALSWVFLCLLPVAIVIFLFLFYGPLLFAPLGISYSDGIVLLIFPTWSTGMVFPVLWHHFAMKLSFPPFSQVFLHPTMIRERLGKVMLVFFAFVALKSLLANLNTPVASIFSIGITLGSSYVIIAEFEIAQHFAKYTSLMNPLKRRDEL